MPQEPSTNDVIAWPWRLVEEGEVEFTPPPEPYFTRVMREHEEASERARANNYGIVPGPPPKEITQTGFIVRCVLFIIFFAAALYWVPKSDTCSRCVEETCTYAELVVSGCSWVMGTPSAAERPTIMGTPDAISRR